MASKDTLRYGFKAKSERLARKFREELKIHPCAPLCAFKLAENLQIPVRKATDILTSQEHINLLSGANGEVCEWSALTMVAESGNRIIIYNPFHSEARQQSDIMHELAHIICKHDRYQKEYDFEIPFGMREFNEVQEEEAKCLGSTLQLATPGLLFARKRKMSTEEVAAHFNASVEMVKYRMNMTGIAKQAYFKAKVS